MAEEEQDYYAEGCEAYDSGKEEAACPYDIDSPEGQEWIGGYWDAEFLAGGDIAEEYQCQK